MKYIAAVMPKKAETKRVEAHLMPDIIEDLKTLADAQNRSLKNYIETVLIEDSKKAKMNKARV